MDTANYPIISFSYKHSLGSEPKIKCAAGTHKRYYKSSNLNELTIKLTEIFKNNLNAIKNFIDTEDNKPIKAKYKNMLSTLLDNINHIEKCITPQPNLSQMTNPKLKNDPHDNYIRFNSEYSYYVMEICNSANIKQLSNKFSVLIANAFYYIVYNEHNDQNGLADRLTSLLQKLKELFLQIDDIEGENNRSFKSLLSPHYLGGKDNPIELCEILENFTSGIESCFSIYNSMKQTNINLFSSIPVCLFKLISDRIQTNFSNIDLFSTVNKNYEFIKPYNASSSTPTNTFHFKSGWYRNNDVNIYLDGQRFKHLSNYMLGLTNASVNTLPENLKTLIEEIFSNIYTSKKPNNKLIQQLVEIQELLICLSPYEFSNTDFDFDPKGLTFSSELEPMIKKTLAVLRLAFTLQGKKTILSMLPEELVRLIKSYQTIDRSLPS